MVTWALGPVAVFFAAMPPSWAAAQSGPAAPDTMAQAVAGGPANSGALAPSQIIVQLRSAGFIPLSRPVQRGGVYVLFALDRQYMDVRLTVDAGNGRVLSVTRLAGARYGGPRFEGYEVLSRYERPVPPANIPNLRPARNNASARRSPPLPRARPDDVTTGVAKGTVPEAHAEPRAAIAPSQPGVAPAGTSPTGPSMVPVAPLN